MSKPNKKSLCFNDNNTKSNYINIHNSNPINSKNMLFMPDDSIKINTCNTNKINHILKHNTTKTYNSNSNSLSNSNINLNNYNNSNNIQNNLISINHDTRTSRLKKRFFLARKEDMGKTIKNLIKESFENSSKYFEEIPNVIIGRVPKGPIEDKENNSYIMRSIVGGNDVIRELKKSKRKNFNYKLKPTSNNNVANNVNYNTNNSIRNNKRYNSIISNKQNLLDKSINSISSNYSSSKNNLKYSNISRLNNNTMFVGHMFNNNSSSLNTNRGNFTFEYIDNNRINEIENKYKYIAETNKKLENSLDKTNLQKANLVNNMAFNYLLSDNNKNHIYRSNNKRNSIESVNKTSLLNNNLTTFSSDDKLPKLENSNVFNNIDNKKRNLLNNAIYNNNNNNNKCNLSTIDKYNEKLYKYLDKESKIIANKEEIYNLPIDMRKDIILQEKTIIKHDINKKYLINLEKSLESITKKNKKELLHNAGESYLVKKELINLIESKIPIEEKRGIFNWIISLRKPKNFTGKRTAFINYGSEINPIWQHLRDVYPLNFEKISNPNQRLNENEINSIYNNFKNNKEEIKEMKGIESYKVNLFINIHIFIFE